MRETIVKVNTTIRNHLSKDLGVFASLLFEIGSGRLLIRDKTNPIFNIDEDKAEKAAKLRHTECLAEKREESEDTEIRKFLVIW
jgi:type II restriction enzyme